jgi:zinc/manganese transport system substrate-binding protein/manganese/iron transport system substrate-binding protein
MVRNVGGDRAEVVTLVGSNVDPHTYEPTPADIQRLVEARIIFSNGLGLETWLDRLVRTSGTTAIVVPLATGIPTRMVTEDGRTLADPHIWFDVQNVITMTMTIRDTLTAGDPSGASAYAHRADAYITKLRDLDRYIVRRVNSLPRERRKLVTNHDTFGYFAARYGFEVIGTVFKSVDPQQEPSARELAQLVAMIRAERVPAIFTENTVNPKLAEALAREAGVRVVTSLYTDSLGPAGSAGSTYLDMMRINVDTIVAALQE